MHDFGARTGLPLPRTVDELAARLEDAARTLRRVPGSKHSQPARDMRSNWPDYVRDTREAYGYQVARGGAVKATAAEIARLDEMLHLVSMHWNARSLRRSHLPEDAGALAWLRVGAGWQMKRLADWRKQRYGLTHPPGGLSRESIRTLVQRAMEHMVREMGADVKPAEIQPDEPQVVWGVDVDFEAEQRVAAILGDGNVLVRTRHARATWQEMPKGRKP